MAEFLRQSKTLTTVIIAGIVSIALLRLWRGYGHYQGDERAYSGWAESVLEGHIPFVDWSPGIVATYAPFHLFSISNDLSLVAFKAALVAISTICLWIVVRRYTNRWVAYGVAAAIVLNPLATNGQSIQLAFAATASLLMVLITNANQRTKTTLIAVLLASLIRPEFGIASIIFFIAILLVRSIRPNISKLEIGIVALVGLAVFLFLLLGPKASNYPGGRMLQAFGQNHTRFHSAPGVTDPWNDWGTSVRYWFGDIKSPWAAMRANPSEFVDFAINNVTSLVENALNVARVGDRAILVYPTGITVSILALFGLAHLVKTIRVTRAIDTGTLMLFALIIPIFGYTLIGHQQSVIDHLLVPILILAAIGFHQLSNLVVSKRRQSSG